MPDAILPSIKGGQDKPHQTGPENALTARIDGRNIILDVFVPGKPAPKGSRAYKGQRNGRAVLVESSRYAKPWQDTISAFVRIHLGGREPLTGPVSMRLEFVMPRPKSTPKRLPTPWAIKRPDCDKLARLVFDACTVAGVYRDDSQVVELRATKRIAEIAEPPGVLIQIVEPSGHTDHA